MLTLVQTLFHVAHIATASVWLSAGLADNHVCLKNATDQIYLQSSPEAIGSRLARLKNLKTDKKMSQKSNLKDTFFILRVCSHDHFPLCEKHAPGANLLIQLQFVGNILSSASHSSLHIYPHYLLIRTVICSHKAEHSSLEEPPGKEICFIVCFLVRQFVSITYLDKDLPAAVLGRLKRKNIV